MFDIETLESVSNAVRSLNSLLSSFNLEVAIVPRTQKNSNKVRSNGQKIYWRKIREISEKNGISPAKARVLYKNKPVVESIESAKWDVQARKRLSRGISQYHKRLRAICQEQKCSYDQAREIYREEAA